VEPLAQLVAGQVAPPPVHLTSQVAAEAQFTSTLMQFVGPPPLQSYMQVAFAQLSVPLQALPPAVQFKLQFAMESQSMLVQPPPCEQL
jgi:hypothetical protein